MPPESRSGSKSTSLSHYLAALAPNKDNDNDKKNLTLKDSRKGREPILRILEDAGIDSFDPSDVVRLPLWSSIAELYYSSSSSNSNSSRNSNSNSNDDREHSAGGPVVLGLEGCAGFRERVPAGDRFLGVAGNFNSGTTAFGISLQTNCRMPVGRSNDRHGHAQPQQQQQQQQPQPQPGGGGGTRRRRQRFVVTNVNGMLSQVPWAKHKMASYRHNNNNNNANVRGANGNHTAATLQPPTPPPHETVATTTTPKATTTTTTTTATATTPPPSSSSSSFYSMVVDTDVDTNAIDHDRVLPVVLVRDPFYWMQSMCKEGYGVRWDHDPKHHCPNLVPNEFDRYQTRARTRARTRTRNKVAKRFAIANQSSVLVWMGPNPTDGPTWPSLVHYWNAWYESYYYNDNNSNDNNSNNNNSKDKDKDNHDGKTMDEHEAGRKWPRLIIRFEDTLFYPQQVMAQVCRCGGGTLVSDESTATAESTAKPPPSSSSSRPSDPSRHDHDHDGATNQNNQPRQAQAQAPQPASSSSRSYRYSLEEAKPDHKHERKNNFVTAVIQYGTNETRFRNMTKDDLRFAVEHLNPVLMEAFGYSYPTTRDAT